MDDEWEKKDISIMPLQKMFQVSMQRLNWLTQPLESFIRQPVEDDSDLKQDRIELLQKKNWNCNILVHIYQEHQVTDHDTINNLTN